MWHELVPPSLIRIILSVAFSFGLCFVIKWIAIWNNGQLPVMGKDNTSGLGHHRQATREATSLSNWHMKRLRRIVESSCVRTRQRQCMESRPQHNWNPMGLMSYSFVHFVTFLVSIERKCHIISDTIVLNKLTWTQSKRISARCTSCFIGFIIKLQII